MTTPVNTIRVKLSAFDGHTICVPAEVLLHQQVAIEVDDDRYVLAYGGWSKAGKVFVPTSEADFRDLKPKADLSVVAD